MKYRVNDTTDYGTHNGVRESEIEPMLRDAVQSYGLNYFDITLYTDSLSTESVARALNNDPELLAIAKSSYTPFPMHNDWTDEAKERYRVEMENGTAPGCADINDAIIEDHVRRIVDSRVYEYIAQRYAQCQKTICQAQQQKDIPSPVVARQREHEWNGAYNEGGYGFVPHVIDSDEYAAAQAFVERYAAVIERA